VRTAAAGDTLSSSPSGAIKPMSETEIARVGVRLGATSGGSRPDPYGTAEIRQLFPTMMKDKAASIHIPRHRRARLGLAIGLVLALMEGFVRRADITPD
jgi:hypothetical protein